MTDKNQEQHIINELIRINRCLDILTTMLRELIELTREGRVKDE